MKRNNSGTLTFNKLVVVADTYKQQHQKWDEPHDNPGALKELCRGDHQGNHKRCQRTQAIDDHAALPSFLLSSQAPPVAYHAIL